MFGLSSSLTTIITAIFGLMISLVIYMPNYFKMKTKLWLVIKFSISIVFSVLVILFVDVRIDSFFYLGSFIGIGFILRGAFNSSRMTVESYLLSYFFFSFIFLSFEQIYLFIINLGIVYVLFLLISSFRFFRIQENEQDAEKKNLKYIIPSFVFLMSFLTVFGFILYDLLTDQIITVSDMSLFDIFEKQYDLIAFIIIFIVFVVLAILLFLNDFKSKQTKRKDKSWYS